jgi:hypothetical protein
MDLRKGAVGVAVSVAMVTGLSTGIAVADENYKPTTLGNADYTNYTDLRNDIYVDGMNYVGSISNQNSDTLDATSALASQFGEQTSDAYALRVTNKLDQTITKLAIKASDESSFTDLGLGGNLDTGDEACWWYTQEYRETSITNRSGMEYTTPVTYTLQATLSNGDKVEFHEVNLKGVLTLAFCYSDDYEVNYVERTTITNHTPDPTLYYEYNLSRGSAADSDTTYTADEMAYHVYSAARMDNRQITESRGGGWDEGVPVWSDVDYAPDFGVFVPLYGEPNEDYTDGTYNHLLWNAKNIIWRVSNGDAGVWHEVGDVDGAGDYGTDTNNEVDYHPGMEEGDWTYTSGE